MTQFEKLDLLLRECGGTIQTFQVLNNGISKSVFYAYVKERGLEQAAHGVYVSPDTWTDAMYLLHLRCGQAVFSHETALFFHDLTDREPLKYTITVRTGYNPSRLQEDGFQVYTVKKDLHEIGIIAMQTSFGHSVPVYDMERTICDLLRSRKNVEMQVFQDALKQYAKRKDKNLRMPILCASSGVVSPTAKDCIKCRPKCVPRSPAASRVHANSISAVSSSQPKEDASSFPSVFSGFKI